MRALGLGDLVLVVRELQVLAATVDVELAPQQRPGHRRALDVPARPTRAPRTGPARFARLGRLPQHEVERVLLGLAHLHPLAGAQVVGVLAAQLAVAGKATHPVVHVAVRRGVGQTARLEGADHVEHLRHVLGGLGFKVGADHAQRLGVLVHGGDEASGQLADALAIFGGAFDDLVVNISDIAHISHLHAAFTQPSCDNVKDHHDPRVADMAEVIDGHAAHVHAHLTRNDRAEGFLLAGQAVVKTEHFSVWCAVGTSGDRERRFPVSDGDASAVKPFYTDRQSCSKRSGGVRSGRRRA